MKSKGWRKDRWRKEERRKWSGEGGQEAESMWLELHASEEGRRGWPGMLSPPLPTTPYPRPSLTFFPTYVFYYQKEGWVKLKWDNATYIKDWESRHREVKWLIQGRPWSRKLWSPDFLQCFFFSVAPDLLISQWREWQWPRGPTLNGSQQLLEPFCSPRNGH